MRPEQHSRSFRIRVPGLDAFRVQRSVCLPTGSPSILHHSRLPKLSIACLRTSSVPSSLSSLLTLLHSYDSIRYQFSRLGIWQCLHKPPNSPNLFPSFIPLPTRIFIFALRLWLLGLCLPFSSIFASVSYPSLLALCFRLYLLFFSLPSAFPDTPTHTFPPHTATILIVYTSYKLHTSTFISDHLPCKRPLFFLYLS